MTQPKETKPKSPPRTPKASRTKGPNPRPIDSPPLLDKIDPTRVHYAMLSGAFTAINDELFSGRLPFALITNARKNSRTAGYFRAETWVKPSDEARKDTKDEIAINGEHFAEVGPKGVLAMMCHEMTHQWQHHYGTTPRAGYHDRQWSDRMLRLGLQTTTTGKPGGKTTGQRMSQMIIPGAAFEALANRLTGPPLHWTYEYAKDPDPQKPTPPRKAVSKLRYTCPTCGTNIWGKPGLIVMCAQELCESNPYTSESEPDQRAQFIPEAQPEGGGQPTL